MIPIRLQLFGGTIESLKFIAINALNLSLILYKTKISNHSEFQRQDEIPGHKTNTVCILYGWYHEKNLNIIVHVAKNIVQRPCDDSCMEIYHINKDIRNVLLTRDDNIHIRRNIN